MISLLVTLLFIGIVIGVLFPGEKHTFNLRRAQTRVRSVRGPNMMRWLGVLALSMLLVEVATVPAIAGIPGAVEVLAILIVLLVIGVGAGLRIVEVIVAVVSLGVFLLSIGIDGAVTLVVATLLLAWIFGAARGFLG